MGLISAECHRIGSDRRVAAYYLHATSMILLFMLLVHPELGFLTYKTDGSSYRTSMTAIGPALYTKAPSTYAETFGAVAPALTCDSTDVECQTCIAARVMYVFLLGSMAWMQIQLQYSQPRQDGIITVQTEKTTEGDTKVVKTIRRDDLVTTVTMFPSRVAKRRRAGVYRDNPFTSGLTRDNCLCHVFSKLTNAILNTVCYISMVVTQGLCAHWRTRNYISTGGYDFIAPAGWIINGVSFFIMVTALVLFFTDWSIRFKKAEDKQQAETRSVQMSRVERGGANHGMMESDTTNQEMEDVTDAVDQGAAATTVEAARAIQRSREFRNAANAMVGISITMQLVLILHPHTGYVTYEALTTDNVNAIAGVSPLGVTFYAVSPSSTWLSVSSGVSPRSAYTNFQFTTCTLDSSSTVSLTAAQTKECHACYSSEIFYFLLVSALLYTLCFASGDIKQVYVAIAILASINLAYITCTILCLQRLLTDGGILDSWFNSSTQSHRFYAPIGVIATGLSTVFSFVGIILRYKGIVAFEAAAPRKQAPSAQVHTESSEV
jgi:uncharacterized membrane protein